MFGKKIPIFKLIGFSVYIDPSWFLILFLITWSLATGAFPDYFEGLNPQVYWMMGFAGAMGLFASIVLHELSHSVVARRFGVEIKGITLFIFGGVAELGSEPDSPKAEFWIAIAGPLASVAISAICWFVWNLGVAADWPVPIIGVFGYLALINIVLVAFNIIPAFPLDGGRVFRSILWRTSGDLRRATKRASQVGTAFGFILIGMGIFSFIGGNYIGGIWWALIGMFLRTAAASNYNSVVMKQALGGEPVGKFMTANPVAVPADATIRQFVEEFVYRHHHKLYPVVSGNEVSGCIELSDVKHVEPGDWDSTLVDSKSKYLSAENSIDANTDAMEAMNKMNQLRRSRMLVTRGGQVVGVVALKDLMTVLSLKLELEGS